MQVAVSLRATENIANTALGKGDRKRDQRTADASHTSRGVKVRDGSTGGRRVIRVQPTRCKTGPFFQGNNAACDTWSIWADDRDLTDEARSARYSDPTGMLRGWSTLIHGVLTSYGYLHD